MYRDSISRPASVFAECANAFTDGLAMSFSKTRISVAPSVSRRRFIQGAASVGAFTALSVPQRAKAELAGDTFDLTIGETPVEIAGRKSIAAGIDGATPGPILRWRQGDIVTINVANRLSTPTSLHWHGIRTPSGMDGVPGLSFGGIAPGQSFTYRFPVHQSGTYWYHSHSGFQEQTGLYGAIVIEPKGGYGEAFSSDHVVLLSEWSADDPETIVSNLKFQSDYYDYGQRTAGTFLADAQRDGLKQTVADRMSWGEMRMSPTDIADVTGAVYTYLMNGRPPADNWSALFRPGERVRLRFINAASMTFFDIRIPGLKMTIVQADGNDVEPVAVDEFRIGAGETYDVIVEPGDQAYTIFAQSADRSGFARGTLAPGPGMAAPIPAPDARPLRTMADMGMQGMGGMKMDAMPGMKMDDGPQGAKEGVAVDNIAMAPTDRLGESGDGLDGNGRRVLSYADLRAKMKGDDPRPPSREITLRLTGNMYRYIWGFDGKKLSEAEPIRLNLYERVRFVLINDTMMEHPIHLHGLWSELENSQGEFRPYKHTIIVKPGERLSTLVTADEPGRWAFHCHLLYHMAMGMMRVVEVV
jgi:FtsP/CotA-like multicopper oxidase with cupredoxin domain